MHHARRSVRLKRPGSRNSATSAKVALKDPGQWRAQQSPSNSSSSMSPPSEIPGLSKWARPPPPPVSQTPLPSMSKWAPPSGYQQQLQRPPGYSRTSPSWASSSGSRTVEKRPAKEPPPLPMSVPSSQRLSRWGLADPNASTSFRRDSPPTQSTRSSQAFERDALPHRNSPVPSSSSQPSYRVSSNSTVSKSDVRRTPFTEQVPRGIDLETDAELSSTGDGTRTSRTRRMAEKDSYKARGSLLSGKNSFRRESDEGEIDATTSKEKLKLKRKNKPVNLKKVTADVFIPSLISVGNLARLLNVRLDRLQRRMTQVGMGEETSYDHVLTAEYASLIAMEFNRNPVVNDEAAFDIYPPPLTADRTSLPSRPPVVTIMGHVDHGKTTLLDTLRSSSVAKGEAGGITQHIGAFSVPVPHADSNGQRTITFLDTPGHAAFSAMRARGASVTDIVVLVVAADDGIMPQTREVLELVKKEGNKVGLVVAINKIDRPGADVSRVENSLLAEGVQLETFGGDIPVVHVSGLTGQGLPDLVETISTVAEVQDIRAEQTGPIQGYVLESRVDKGLGPVATVLILRGQLTPGANMISGAAHGKVRLLKSPAGESMKLVGPGDAALVSGWKELPKAGDEVLQGTENEIKRALANRSRKADIEATIQDAEAINESRRAEREHREKEEEDGPSVSHSQEDQKKELRLVIKGDVSGTVEAVSGAVQGIGNHLAGVKVIATGVGEVSESDVMRAKAVDGMVVAFSVNTPRPVRAIAASQGVTILESRIIYALMDEVKKNVIDLLPTTTEHRVTGEATVLQLFDIHLKAKQTMKVAGCRVTNGTVEKNKKARVVRDGETVFEGNLETLKHLKRDIAEANKGLECGMAFEGWDDLREGDIIKTYQEVVKPGTL